MTWLKQWLAWWQWRRMPLPAHVKGRGPFALSYASLWTVAASMERGERGLTKPADEKK